MLCPCQRSAGVCLIITAGMTNIARQGQALADSIPMLVISNVIVAMPGLGQGGYGCPASSR